MPTVQNVVNPTYKNAEGTVIDCQVKFAEFADYLPFAATSYDVEPYGVQIYNDCVAGVYGPVAPYVPLS